MNNKIVTHIRKKNFREFITNRRNEKQEKSGKTAKNLLDKH